MLIVKVKKGNLCSGRSWIEERDRETRLKRDGWYKISRASPQHVQS